MLYGRPPKVTIFLDHQHASPTGKLTILFRVNFAKGEKDPTTGKYKTPKRVQFSTGHQCTVSQFDPKKRRVRSTHQSAAAINAVLDEMESRTQYLWLEANRKGLDGYSVIRDEFRGKPSLSANFMDHFRLFLDFYKASASPASKTTTDEIFRARTEGTVRIYQTLYNDLIAFQAKTHYPLLYTTIDQRFQNQFAAYLAERESGCSTNSVQKKFEYLKSMLREFKKKGYQVDSAYEQWEKIANQTEPTEFALSDKELHRIIELNMDGRKAQIKRVRDQFVFMALTGVRFSDALRISKDNLTTHNDRIVLSFISQKTKANVTIPFTKDSIALTIFQAYNYQFEKISIMNFNLHLKTIAELVGITDTYKEERFIGNDRRIEIVRKCDAIGSHTARRTFATIAFNKGVNIRFIQEMLGHKTMAQTESYIKSTLGFVDAGRIAAFDDAARGTEQGFAGV